ncbi:MAG: DNA repair protein RadA [Geminicoccaceae bacterium]|nr:DNA repair protein RadA [Geminicoccaceae bacterium]
MAKPRNVFVCQSCGNVQPKWTGRCEACLEWNTLQEEREAAEARPKGAASARGRAGLVLSGMKGTERMPPRLATGIEELDRALGGGIVKGSAMLLGGDPGIGKSTLTLQAAAALATAGRGVVYVTGEESAEQIRLRAQRLGLEDTPIGLGVATSVQDILATVDGPTAPDLLVIDSIQTMHVEGLEPAPGTVTQLRAASHDLIRFAKKRGTAVLLIGHVTKEGQIAGPRVLEHMVDTVLYFEGERGHQFRIIRAVKNRFGPANEIGVFEMREAGLHPVGNPSALFLADREEGIAGAAVFAGIEGTRPILVEVQALVAPSPLATPRRAVVGWDGNRLAMILAVLEARCGLVMSGRDVYLNVAGGLKVGEPGADLAVAAALVSSLADRPVPGQTVVFGEVGLAGEVRPVAQTDARLREAQKLGFKRAVVPRMAKPPKGGIALVETTRLADLVALIGPVRRGRRREEALDA